MANNNSDQEPYELDYQRTHDIDWFFKHDGIYYHVASNGGGVPDFISESKNKELQQIIRNNTKYRLKIVVNERYRHLNLESFEFYAKWGFVSIDRLDHNSFETQNYVVIAKPCKIGDNQENLKKLDDDIKIPELEDTNEFLLIVNDMDGQQLIP